MAAVLNIEKKPLKSRQLKLTRAERAVLVERRLFDAAIKVVGANGYAEATVSRITKLAGVAQGTFYNYFPSRQDLLDRLLPDVGRILLDFIGDRIDPNLDEFDREMVRFQSFFDFLEVMPQFLRILNEAQVYAPVAFERHINMVAENYTKALRQGGLTKDKMSDDELEAAVYVLMGARSYLCQKFSYTDNTVHKAPESVFTAYRKIMGQTLFDRKQDPAPRLVHNKP